MSRFNNPTPIKSAAGWLAGLLLAAAPLATQAATNTFNFSNTTVSSGSGPVNPANGATAISGASLNAGDVVVFDGVVINTTGTTSDNWAAIELNAGGYLGLTSATLGVLAESGSASGNQWQLFINGASTKFGNAASDARTNRVHIELDCTQTGSTTNMTYLAEIDQGVTGTFTGSLNGTGLTFPGNTIPLKFGANNATYLIAQVQPIIAVSAPSPSTNLVAAGFPATFTATLTQGYPLDTAQQWYSNGVPILGANSLTYTIPVTSASYNGAKYTVVVTNLLTSGNVVTSTPALLVVRSTPGIVPFNFPTTSVAAGGGSVTSSGVSINGTGLLAGDTVVFDGIITPNGSQLSDAWTSIDFAGSGYGDLFGTVGVLARMGSGANPSQLFINGNGVTNPTTGSAATNRVRVEFYPSATGSTTNMGWKVEIDQNLSGVFQPAVSGTNLTFAGNTIPLAFGSSGSASYVYQNPQSPVSIFSGPTPSSQVVAVGAPIAVGVTVEGWSPAFQWRKNGVAISGATNENYTSPAATLADNGDQFTVVVSNRLNSLNVITSSVASVAVLIPNNLTWYPAADFTTWDTATHNWTTNGGSTEITFATGNNVTFDSLGYNIGGSTVNITNNVSPNAVTVNVSGYDTYTFTGTNEINGQSLLVTGDGTGTLDLETPGSDSYNAVTITAFGGSVVTNTTLSIGANGVDSAFNANFITNNGVIEFNDSDPNSLLAVSGQITGSGYIIQNGTGTTVLSATNSAYAIQSVNAGALSIASTPLPGPIVNNATIEPASAASVLAIPNAISGYGNFYFTGFQTTILTGDSSFTGENLLFWSDVIVDNPAALGDPNNGYSIISGADRFGGLYLSNSIVWTQPLELDTRYATGQAATAPHIANWSGTNDVTSAITLDTGTAAGVSGTEINVEATTGQLTIDAAGSLNNAAFNTPMDLNLQGAGVGFWNSVLEDSVDNIPLNVLMRGTGVWTLGGDNTYSGTTTVASGTLLVTGQISAGNVSVNSGGTLGGGGLIGGAVTVASGGTLEVTNGSVGTLTIEGALTLNSGSTTKLQINKTAASNDQITGLTSVTYGGTLVVTNLAGTLTTSDSFPLFSSTAYAGAFAAISPASPGPGLAWNTNTLAVDGTLRIVTGGPSTTPTPITATVSGSSLHLAWPADHTGWRLVVQTNSLSVGLNPSTNAWTTVPGSTTVDQATITIDPTQPTVFYRLVYP